MNRKKMGVLLSGCITFLGIDIITKAYSYYSIPPMNISSSAFPYGGIGVFRDVLGVDFSINYVMNRGAAWGLLASYQEPLLYTRMIIILFLLAYLFVGKMSFGKRVALSSIATGALGNVIDYFAYGHVIDMFYFNFWGYSYPVFNVADSLIFVGICLLFIQTLFEKKSDPVPLSHSKS